MSNINDWGTDIVDYKQILYFKTIAEEGTISKAAIKLNMAQPPISKQLQALESELGVSLMKRGGRNIELSDAGKVFYKRCLQIVSLTELTYTELQNYNTHQSLQIGVTSSNVAIMHRPYVEPFFKKHSDIVFEITEGNTYEIISKIKSHLIDIAFIRTPFDPADLEFLTLREDNMMAVGFSKYLKTNEPITLESLSSLPIIIHRRYADFFLDVCLNHQLTPKILCKTDDCRTSLLWAQKGRGVAIVPLSACDFSNSRYINSSPILSPELNSSTAIVWRKDTYLTPIQNEFIDCFR